MCGSLNVVPSAGVLKRAILLVELDRGGSKTVLCCDGKQWLVLRILE